MIKLYGLNVSPFVRKIMDPEVPVYPTDLALASPFVKTGYARYTIDAAKWPMNGGCRC